MVNNNPSAVAMLHFKRSSFNNNKCYNWRYQQKKLNLPFLDPSTLHLQVLQWTKRNPGKNRFNCIKSYHTLWRTIKRSFYDYAKNVREAKKRRKRKNYGQASYEFSQPLMYKNSITSEFSKQIQAFRIGLRIPYASLTRAASMAHKEEELINQTDNPCLNQPWDQMKLGPFHIHLHSHKIPIGNSTCKPVCKIKT